MKWGWREGDDFEVFRFYVGGQELVCFEGKSQADMGSNTSFTI